MIMHMVECSEKETSNAHRYVVHPWGVLWFTVCDSQHVMLVMGAVGAQTFQCLTWAMMVANKQLELIDMVTSLD